MLTLACAAGWRWERARSELTLMAVCAGGMALLGAAAVIHGWGFNGPAIGFIALLSFLMGATVSVRLACRSPPSAR